MTTLVWFIIGFGCGALPFSVWVGRLALRTDIRGYGDYNPGAANVIRAGGWWWGMLALLLDYFKGVIPVGMAHFFAGLTGGSLAVVALAPVLGHAYSPFLGFRGGKAVAVTFGIWTGLTLGEIPLVLGLLLVFWFIVVAASGWAVLLAMLGLLPYLLLIHFDPVLLAVWVGNMLLLTWKHRAELKQPPGLRSWLKKRLPQ
ncbi:MAG: glycerol-3-phosphate acyltransferase [Anaerolineae bacterium]|nr:glycerol-3-phosphate acyltransferase [Anaerolineae bacterium]